jgi:acyl-coenzyme A synthetase/AMP-(fatty) acid ligase
MSAPAFIPASQLLARGRPGDSTVCTDGGHRIAWGDFAARAGGIARALAGRTERRWLIRCEHPLDFIAALLAVLHSNGRAVIAPGPQPGMIEQLRPAYDAVIGDGAPATLDVADIEPCRHEFQIIAPRGAMIDLFTSGSSGEPKRIEKSLAQLETEAAALESCWGTAIGRATMVATVPHHHIYGMLFRLVWPLASGRPFDAALCADPRLLLDTLARAGDAVLVSSPAHLTRLPELISLESLRPAARRIFSSGGPLPAATAEEYNRRLGAPPTEVYGSTESGGVAWREQDASEHGTAWTPFAGLGLRLDPQGALCLRSPYLADEAWLTMGDAAELLPDGRFRLKGRLDRIVKIEGKRISLPELEHALRQHPWVLDAAVVPLTGGKELLGAVVVLREAARLHEGREPLVGALREFLLQRFERVLVPRQWRFPERLPADERGKLTAAGLGAMFRQQQGGDAPAA